MATDPLVPRRPARGPGVMFGIGLGAFVDGIVLHQLLQWHHMLSSEEPVTTVAGLELNTTADGLFHAVAWCIVLVASLMTVSQWRQGRLAPSWSFHLGGVVAGWAGFNLVEGIVDHEILGVHHVRDDLGGPLSWDLGFLAVSLLLLLAGLLLQRRGERTLVTGAQPSPRAGD